MALTGFFFIFFKCVGGGLYHHWFVFLSFYKAKGGKQLDPKEDSQFSWKLCGIKGGVFT